MGVAFFSAKCWAFFKLEWFMLSLSCGQRIGIFLLLVVLMIEKVPWALATYDQADGGPQRVCREVLGRSDSLSNHIGKLVLDVDMENGYKHLRRNIEICGSCSL